MTVLVGYGDDSGYYLAADTLFAEGDNRVLDGRKIIHCSSFAVAVAGERRAMNVISEAAEKTIPAMEDHGIASLAMAIRKILQDDGFLRRSPSGSFDWPGAMIVACPTGLFSLACNFAYDRAPIGEPITYGSGSDLAIGAMVASKSTPIKDRLVLALSVAAKYSLSCGGAADLLHFAPNVDGPTIERLPLLAL